MKLTTTLLSLLPATLTLATPSGFERILPRQSTGSSTLSYDTVYDVAGSSLNTVACSTGDFGLITEGYTTFGSLPSFARIGGAPTIPSGASPNCGACYQVSWTSATGQTSSIVLTAIDSSVGGFNVAQAAMDELTGGRAVDLGRIDVTWTQVDRQQCGLAPRA